MRTRYVRTYRTSPHTFEVFIILILNYGVVLLAYRARSYQHIYQVISFPSLSSRVEEISLSDRSIEIVCIDFVGSSRREEFRVKFDVNETSFPAAKAVLIQVPYHPAPLLPPQRSTGVTLEVRRIRVPLRLWFCPQDWSQEHFLQWVAIASNSSHRLKISRFGLSCAAFSPFPTKI